MKATQPNSPIENSISKIKSNLEKMSNIMSRRPQKQIKRGRQPFCQKLKYFPQPDEIKPCFSQFNLIPKKNVRVKNRSNQKLLIKHINNKQEDKKNIDENESESEFSNSYSRENRKVKMIGDYKNTNIYNYPTKKDVGLYSSEDENSSDNSLIEENFGIEIERILIEIYNKNISNIHNSSGKKNKIETNETIPGEEHVRFFI